MRRFQFGYDRIRLAGGPCPPRSFGAEGRGEQGSPAKRPNRAAAFIIGSIFLALCPPLLAAGKLNYQDNALPLFRDNCLSCHNPDKKADGLDLSSYSGMLAGNSDGPVIAPGDPENSTLYRVITHEDEPTMPPKRDKLPKADLDLIKAWIAAGALETANGKPPIPASPVANLTLSATSAEVAPTIVPMPGKLMLNPVVHTRRSGALDCLAASPWAPIVAVGGQHQVILYDVRTCRLLGILPFPEGEPRVARFSRTGQLLLIGGGRAAVSGKCAIWDITTGRHITDVGNEFDSVLAADISPDQSTVALGGPGKTLKLYSTRDGSLIKSIAKVYTDWILALAFSPDGKLLAAGDRAGNLHVWDAATLDEIYDLPTQKGPVTTLAFRRDSNILATGNDDGILALWDMTSGKLIKSWRAHSDGVTSVSFAHDGRIVSCGRDRKLLVWRPDGSPAAAVDQFSDLPLHAVFTAGDHYLVAGDWTGDIRVYQAADDKHEVKKVGSLSNDPRPLSEQIANAQKRLDAATQADTRAQAELNAAQAADDALQAGDDPSTTKPGVTARVSSGLRLRLEESSPKSDSGSDTKPAAPPSPTGPKGDSRQLAASRARLRAATAAAQHTAAELKAAQAELSRLQSAGQPVRSAQ
ncbi:MAG TPA: c-type cytochrome domain-containing protein [Tepidisphaeraceae bacterium]|nr:c-type cytochrome domain-containing protein [Tepidisphaeraceae bacterium]